MAPDPVQEIERLASQYGQDHDCDVVLFTGDLSEDSYKQLKNSLPHPGRTNVLLMLATRGGDAHAAFRMGRLLQRTYKEVRVFIPGRCKSAGTLLAIAAHELTMGDEGEIGPIDIQQMRQDDLWERTSGLIESVALQSLGQVSFNLFEKLITEIKEMSFGRITFRTARSGHPYCYGSSEPHISTD